MPCFAADQLMWSCIEEFFEQLGVYQLGDTLQAELSLGEALPGPGMRRAQDPGLVATLLEPGQQGEEVAGPITAVRLCLVQGRED
eukprot:8600817-Ditylum_brightwellii.AAC.1